MKIHKLIVEGQQYVGKTTIANNLARRYLTGNPFLFKLSGPASGVLDKSFKKYMDDLLLDYANLFRHITANSIICDKFHISEQVYGKYYRGYSHNPEVIEAIESILHELGFKIIFLEMDDKLIDERIRLKEVEFKMERDELESPTVQKKIKKLYNEFVSKSRLETIRVDVTNQSVLETVQEIMTKI